MGEAIGKFFVFHDKRFVGGGVAEGSVEGAGERSAIEHFFHEALRDFGEVVFHDAIDVFPEVAGGNRGGCGSGRGGGREIYAKYGEIFRPVDGGVLCVFRGFGKEFGEACRVEVAQKFAVFLERVRHGFCGGVGAGNGGGTARELAVYNGLECCDFEFDDGDIGVWAFLNIDEADFDGPAVKACDGSTAI